MESVRGVISQVLSDGQEMANMVSPAAGRVLRLTLESTLHTQDTLLKLLKLNAFKGDLVSSTFREEYVILYLDYLICVLVLR